MNTYETLELNNGQTIKLTLNLKRLLLLKNNNRTLYVDANRIITKGADDIFDMVKILYTGYLCALEGGVEPMSYEIFMDEIPQSIGEISSLAANLITAKKK